MTARTRSAKLEQKRARGRPPLPANDREPNGQPSRRKEAIKMRTEATEAEIQSVVVERRIREGNIIEFKARDGKTVTAAEQAKDPRRGYALGLLLLGKRINQAQHDAGVRFAEDMARFYSLTGIQPPSPRAQNLFAVKGRDGEETESRAEQAKRARASIKGAGAVLLAVGDINTGRKVMHCMTEVAVMDNQDAARWATFQIELLKRGLNKLAVYYGVQSL